MSSSAISSILAAYKKNQQDKKQATESKTKTKTKAMSESSDDSDSDTTMETLPRPALLSDQFEIVSEEKSIEPDNSSTNKSTIDKSNAAALARMSKQAISEDSPSSDDSKKPIKIVKNCYCSKGKRPARQAQVKTPGANFNRTYYCCNRDRDDDNNCQYFEWAVNEEDRKFGVFCKCSTTGGDDDEDSSSEDDDEDGSKKLSKQLARKKAQDAAKIPAVRQQVKKEGPNYGRYFFSCRLGKSGCQFFQWDTEVRAEKSAPAKRKRIDSSDDDSDDDAY